MLNNVNRYNNNIDVAIFSAAVADFKMKKINSKKIKKNNITSLNLIKNIDILKSISEDKINRPKFIVGFSAETEGKINAKKKLIKKNCNMIIYNKINKNNKVFGLSENKISILTKDKTINYAKTSKINCAKYILDSIYKEIKN